MAVDGAIPGREYRGPDAVLVSFHLEEPPMKVLITFVSAALLASAPAFAQQSKIPNSSDTIKATGDGNSVGMRGRSVELAGNTLRVGDNLPAASLVKPDMGVIDIANNNGKVRILNIVPSLDTTTCDQQTHELAETNEGLDN